MGQYDQMWKDLQLDFDAHCQLFDFLGNIYSDIYLKQEIRPETME